MVAINELRSGMMRLLCNSQRAVHRACVSYSPSVKGMFQLLANLHSNQRMLSSLLAAEDLLVW